MPTPPPAKKTPMSGDRKKLIALGSLLGLLFVVVAWNYTGSTKTAPPRAKPDDGRVPNSQLKAGGATPSQTPDAAPTLVESFGPLEALPAFGVFTGELAATRNVFDYPPPPPPVKPRPPIVVTEPPPTINIGSLSPGSAIAGSSRPVTLTITGRYFPVDAVVLVNSSRAATQRQSDSVLKVTLGARDIASPGTVRIKVVSASQELKLWSRELPFTLQPSPDPSESFIYSGRIGNQAVIGFKDGKKPKTVSVGDSLNGLVLWRIVAINERQVDMLDTRNEIRKSITLTPRSAT